MLRIVLTIHCTAQSILRNTEGASCTRCCTRFKNKIERGCVILRNSQKVKWFFCEFRKLTHPLHPLDAPARAIVPCIKVGVQSQAKSVRFLQGTHRFLFAFCTKIWPICLKTDIMCPHETAQKVQNAV